MNSREQAVINYIQENNLPNAKILNNNDDVFTYYDYDHIPAGLALADSIKLDEEGKPLYGFMKDNTGEEMRLIVGCTGIGKSTRYLANQLLVAAKKGHSAIVTDLSSQMLEYTYNFLKKEHINICVLNLDDSNHSDSYNPLALEAKRCKELGKITEDAENLIDSIANVIITDGITKDKEWSDGARSIFKGVTRGLFEALLEEKIEEKDVNLYNAIMQCYYVRQEIVKENRINKLMDVDYYKWKKYPSQGDQLIIAQVESAPVTRSGYFSVLFSALTKMNNKSFFDVTSSSTFKISDLWEKQTVLFINTNNNEYSDIVAGLLVNELYREASREANKKYLKNLDRPVQLFLDEFANISFGSRNQFEKMITTSRKMHIFFNMFIQNYNQIVTKFGEYGENVLNTIRSNSTEIFLGTKDYDTRQVFASSCGRTTHESLESIYKDEAPVLVTQDLLTPESLRKIKQGEMFIDRLGYDICLTYFEAIYNMPGFKPSNDYKKNYNKKKYDYEKEVVLQPMMVKKVNLRLSNEKIKESVHIDILNDYEDYLNGHLEMECADKMFEKLGFIRYENGEIKYVLTKERLNNILGRNSKKGLNKFFWEDE